MFDFAWSEIALIGVVALVAIGPKDMPVAVRTLSDLVKKARRMAGEFQTHVDEMVREANLGDVRDHINDIRSLNLRGQIAKAIDGDGSLRRTLTENPLAAPAPVPPAAAAEVAQAAAGPADPSALPGFASAQPGTLLPTAGSAPLAEAAPPAEAAPLAGDPAPEAQPAGWSVPAPGPAPAPLAVPRGDVSAAPAFVPPAQAGRLPLPRPRRPVPPAFIPPAAASAALAPPAA